MVLVVFLICVTIFILSYITYASFVAKKFSISDLNKTPAHTMQDNIDYIPTKAPILFGHHFSSIAGAGPIVGPITAGLLFGWAPALVWIVLGTIFIGGVHDFGALVASIRNKAKSIAEISKIYIGKKVYNIFLMFIWLSLVYVLIVFVDLCADNFADDGSVATASFIYIILAVLFGFSIYKIRLNFLFSTIIFVLLVFLSLFFANKYKLVIPPFILKDPKKSWAVVLLVYAFFASVLPVWILLQPRDYLSSFLLYSSVLAGVVGIIFGKFNIEFPSFLAYKTSEETLFPMLFVTIACGAISGFHSLVSSGTTSKQLNKETDAKKIGYGAMVMEGITALIALATVMIISKNVGSLSPTKIYSSGIGKFLSVLKIKKEIGESFGLLVLSTFILTTLDTATRISRYGFQEIFNLDIKKTRVPATLITLLLPTIFVLIDIKDPKTGNPIPAWKSIWPVFGTSNQLLAALVLLVITVWFIKLKKNPMFVFIPMLFMIIVTLTALFQLIFRYKFSPVGIIAIVLFVLAIYMIINTIVVLIKRK